MFKHDVISRTAITDAAFKSGHKNLEN